jgi:hypothetical protein
MGDAVHHHFQRLVIFIAAAFASRAAMPILFRRRLSPVSLSNVGSRLTFNHTSNLKPLNRSPIGEIPRRNAIPFASTHRQQRNLLVLFIASHTLRPRIECRFAVDQELIMMMPVIERDLQMPSSIRLPLHRMSGRVPIVEAANHVNRLGLRREAQKICEEGRPFGGVAIATPRAVIICRKHVLFLTLRLARRFAADQRRVK